jgi:hypothetical protein
MKLWIVIIIASEAKQSRVAHTPRIEIASSREAQLAMTVGG